MTKYCMPLRYIVAALKDGDLEKLYVNFARVSPMNVIIPGFPSVNPTLQPQEEDLKARSTKKVKGKCLIASYDPSQEDL